MHIYYLHLGSNVGKKKEMLDEAIMTIQNKIGHIIVCSSFYETEPWGLKEQENFINMALKLESKLEINDVFDLTKAIELELGGPKEVKWGPRALDIDILYCDDLVINTERLTIPHPHLYNRNFVLVPLVEIAGEFIDPIKKICIDEIYDDCKDEGEVFLFEE